MSDNTPRRPDDERPDPQPEGGSHAQGSSSDPGAREHETSASDPSFRGTSDNPLTQPRRDYLPDTPIADTANSPARLGSASVPRSTVTQVTAEAQLVAGQSADAAQGVEAEAKVTNKAALIIRRLLRNKGSVVGLIMLGLVTLFALFGNIGNNWTYLDQDLLNLGQPPGTAGHRLGTNSGGVDLWAMLVHATGRSLLIAFSVGIGAPLIGAAYGTAIAFWGGRREKVGMWILDMLILMPYFLIIAVIMGSTGGNSFVLAGMLVVFTWTTIARVVRATTASLREREFVKAARYSGVNDLTIIRRHIIPNIGSLLIISIITGTYGAILAETALSFLGVGVRPPDVSLGSLIGQSASQMAAYPWMFWGPAVCLMSITFSIALIGDGLRDALDPNSKAGGRA
ncbi:MAG: ABC transporter permease subunit [Mobilicoccus sp.]|nr:ABC transporter permease subunit [Mobilicoccus sp.]